MLDVTQMDDSRILVSLDTVHKPVSLKTFQGDGSTTIPALQIFEHGKKIKDSANGNSEYPYDWTELTLSAIAQSNEFLAEVENPKAESKVKGRGYETIYSSLGEFLYGLENLRKKRGGTAEEEEEEADEATEVADAAMQELEV